FAKDVSAKDLAAVREATERRLDAFPSLAPPQRRGNNAQRVRPVKPKLRAKPRISGEFAAMLKTLCNAKPARKSAAQAWDGSLNGVRKRTGAKRCALQPGSATSARGRCNAWPAIPGQPRPRRGSASGNGGWTLTQCVTRSPSAPGVGGTPAVGVSSSMEIG